MSFRSADTATMPSSFDKQSAAPQDESPNAHSTRELSAVELSQIYILIDSILPFEACLYYQVLPLFVEGSRLVVGRVNPEDPGAAEYVTKQLSYINYTLGFQQISSDWHRDLLSKYLKYNAKQRQQPTQQALPPPQSDKPTVSAHPAAPAENLAPRNPNIQQTLIIDQPEELTDMQPGVTAPQRPDIPSTANAPVDRPGTAASERLVSTPPSEKSRSRRANADLGPLSDPALDYQAAPLELHLESHYRDLDSTHLSALEPQPLMQALLVKVLAEGIGRLYFERGATSGRVLWSRDGILQAVVEAIDAQTFQGVINEFKLLMRLSLISVTKSKQVEIERAYEGQRILLRFRVMPSAYGEEATVQVLRGTALRFYQQQQIDRLGRDALDAAQMLQTRLNEIRDRARNSIDVRPVQTEILPTLIQLLRQLEAQVEEIEASYQDAPQPLNRPSDQPTPDT